LVNVKNFSDLPQKREKMYLIFGSVEQIKMQDLANASKLIKSGAKVLLSSSDSAHPSAKGEKLIAMPGHLLHMLKKTSPVSFYTTGKPSPFVARKVLQVLRRTSSELDYKDIVFVGDSMDTDIKIAFEHEMKSVLVLSGNTTLEMCKNSVFQPDYIFPSVKELQIFLDKKQTNKRLSLY
jgi:ribonucleotide monophosphatase NagD (HAD superfamily)